MPIEWWRHSGAVGYFHHELGYDYHGPAGLPENFAFNTSDGLFRRLVSTFVSPLATAYMLVIALLLLATLRRRGAPIAIALGGRLRRRPALDVLALVDRRARGRPARPRRRPPQLVARRGRGRRGRRRLRLRRGLPRHRPAHPLVQERPALPGGAGAREGPAPDRQRPLGHVLDRRAVDQEPLGEPEGRHSHGHAPPPGLRPRERGHDRAALRREARGRRVELHGARRRDRDPRRAPLPRPGRRRSSSRCSAPPGEATAPPPRSPPALAATLALAIQTDALRRALARVLSLLAGRGAVDRKERDMAGHHLARADHVDVDAAAALLHRAARRSRSRRRHGRLPVPRC